MLNFTFLDHLFTTLHFRSYLRPLWGVNNPTPLLGLVHTVLHSCVHSFILSVSTQTVGEDRNGDRFFNHNRSRSDVAIRVTWSAKSSIAILRLPNLILSSPLEILSMTTLWCPTPIRNMSDIILRMWTQLSLRFQRTVWPTAMAPVPRTRVVLCPRVVHKTHIDRVVTLPWPRTTPTRQNLCGSYWIQSSRISQCLLSRKRVDFPEEVECCESLIIGA